MSPSRIQVVKQAHALVSVYIMLLSFNSLISLCLGEANSVRHFLKHRHQGLRMELMTSSVLIGFRCLPILEMKQNNFQLTWHMMVLCPTPQLPGVQLH